MKCESCDADVDTLYLVADRPIHRPPEPGEGTAVCLDCSKATLTQLIEDCEFRLKLLRRWLRNLDKEG